MSYFNTINDNKPQGNFYEKISNRISCIIDSIYFYLMSLYILFKLSKDNDMVWRHGKGISLLSSFKAIKP